jgi:predicted Zn-dependent peptidase
MKATLKAPRNAARKKPAPAASTITREVLPNGLAVIAESMPHTHSISLGLWVRSGSRSEPERLNGIAHFIEHMVFKGTSRRTAEQIAKEMDSVGGMLDAFTSKESVCFNAKVLHEHLPLAFDVISDLALRPLFAEADIAKERQVILEEIRMEEDNPESVAHELLTKNFWRGHSLGAPILGTRVTARRFTRAALTDCFRAWYAPKNLLLTAAGRIEMPQLLELARSAFGALKPGERAPHSASAPTPHGLLAARNKPTLEQAHITIALPSNPLADPRRYATSLLNNILGGGMSSRLFQNIREQQGLAYAVFSELTPYQDAGMLSIYAGTARQNVEKVLRLIAAELRRMKQELVSEDELRRAKDHFRGAMVLSLESSGARMSHLARQEMYFGRFFTIEQLQASIEAVTREQIQEIACEFFRPEKIAAAVVGPLKGFHLRRDLLAC